MLQRREERHKVAGCKWDRRGRAVNKQPANTHIKSTMQISTHVQAFPQIDCVCMLKPRKNNHIWTEQNCQSDKCPYLQQYICSRNIFIFLTYSQSHAKKTPTKYKQIQGFLPGPTKHSNFTSTPDALDARLRSNFISTSRSKKAR